MRRLLASSSPEKRHQLIHAAPETAAKSLLKSGPVPGLRLSGIVHSRSLCSKLSMIHVLSVLAQCDLGWSVSSHPVVEVVFWPESGVTTRRHQALITELGNRRT